MADSNLVTQLNYGVEAAQVVTTPIDNTLTTSGVAADAKAAGDAIREVREYMGSGTIPGGAATLLEALTDIRSEIGNNALPDGASTIAEALNILAGQIGDGISGSTLTAAVEQISQAMGSAPLPLEAETVTDALNAILAAAVRTVNGTVPDTDGNVDIDTGVMTINGEGPGEDGNIQIDTGITQISVNGQTPDESGAIAVPTGVMTINGVEPDEDGNIDVDEPEGLVRSVNGEEPDSYGNVALNRVPFADDLYTEDTQAISGSFKARTSGGSASIADSTVVVQRIYGRSERSGYVPASQDMSVSWGDRTEGEPITAAIDWTVFVATVGDVTTDLTISYDGSDWDADLAGYGVTVTGTPVNGDAIHISYVVEERGTITNSVPESLITTGWNLYDNTTGYARVIRYSEQYGYRIDGAYSSIRYCEERGGAETDVTVDGNGLFNVAADGWIHITGGNDTTTAIYPTWSDWAEGTPEAFEVYTEHEIPYWEAVNQIFAAGMCSVGDVRDEMSPQSGSYVRRINRIEYSEANLESVIAGGTDYTYDTDYIYYVLEDPISGTYMLDSSLPVSSHGLEIWDSNVAIDCVFVYTQALKDKLRRNVVTVSAQDLTDDQKEQVRKNIAAYGRKVQQKVMSQIDADGNDNLATLTSYPTEPGVYRVGAPGNVASGLPSGIGGYGALIIYNAGSYRMHLYHDATGCVYSARTTNDAPPANWKLIGGTENVTSRISIAPKIADGQISNFVAYRSGNMVNISFTLKTATGGGIASNIANLTFGDSTLAPRLTSFNIGASANTIAGGRLLTSGEIYLYCSNSTWTAASGINVGVTYLCAG